MMTREQDRPTVLEALPPELRRDASPLRCICSHCAPRLTEVQRAAHERVERDWIATRIAWCESHGYPVLDLIRADIEATATPPARSERARQRFSA
jgi:hypothetical protein